MLIMKKTIINDLRKPNNPTHTENSLWYKSVKSFVSKKMGYPESPKSFENLITSGDGKDIRDYV